MFENTIIIGGIVIAVIVFGLIVLFISMYKKVPQGKALIRSGFGGVQVTFNGIFIIPLIHQKEILDITTQTITIHKTGRDGLPTKDGQKVDVKADFIIKINPTIEDIERIIMTIGVEKANSSKEIEKLFTNKFLEALKVGSSQFEAATIHQHIEGFKINVLNKIGLELDGFTLEDLHIYQLEKN